MKSFKLHPAALSFTVAFITLYAQVANATSVCSTYSHGMTTSIPTVNVYVASSSGEILGTSTIMQQAPSVCMNVSGGSTGQMTVTVNSGMLCGFYEANAASVGVTVNLGTSGAVSSCAVQ